ncbi:MAG: glutamate--tRNA ligase [Rhizobiaceae bacterium]|nr:glutamate--tRNA ligase [Rhizobiaceae bacterium]
MPDRVVTRFAPSPTGFLHIGGARTALFNWLYAKANGGKMLLRVEDTDRKRSTDEATDAIFDGLKWLGIDWDGDALSQFSRAAHHRDIALQLLKSGEAYYCYSSTDELEQLRKEAREQSAPMHYPWRERDPSLAPHDAKPVIRLKTPLEGSTIVNDLVQGDVSFNNKDLDDMVLLRSDGSATYMHAVVVDDHDMGITHIIRGDDHLTNAARQILLYKALGWEVPVMVHIPLIHGSDGAKLSKRHGALGVDAYRAMGFLPQAMKNYLVRLGWSHGDDEIISLEQMIEWFDIDAIGKGASQFDFKKLEYINGVYIKASDNSELLTQLLANARYLEEATHLVEPISNYHSNLLEKAIGLSKEKVKTLNELALATGFVFSQRPIKLDEKANKFLDVEARAVLAELLPYLKNITQWNAEALSEVVREYCESKELKLGKIAQPIRCAVAGTPSAPGVFEVMELFGAKETIARIADVALPD